MTHAHRAATRLHDPTGPAPPLASLGARTAPLAAAAAALLVVQAGAPRPATACDFEFDEPPPLALPAPLPDTRLAHADIDGDGREDVAVTYPGCPGSVHVARATAGGFVLHQVLGPAEGLAGSPAGVALRDLDLDGRADLAVAHLEGTGCGGRGVTVFFQRTDGLFDAGVSWDGDGDGRHLLAADLMGTGLPSLITGDGPRGLNTTTGKAVQLRGNEGPGDFSHVHEYGLQPSGGGVPSLLAAGELDFDDELDVLVFWGERRRVTALCNFGDDTYERASEGPLGADVVALGGMAAADVDQDGRLDVVLSDPSTGRLSIAKTGGAGPDECPFPTGAQPCLSVPGIEDLLLADLDEDEYPEIVGLVPASGTLAFHGGTDVGHFGPARELDVGGTPVRVAAARFNGGSRPDLALLDADGSLRLLVNESGFDRCPRANTDGVVIARTDGSCEADVVLDASGSFDLDGDALTYLWHEDGELIHGTTDEVSSLRLDLGIHDLTLIVRDPAGHESRPVALSVRVLDGTTPDLVADPVEPQECEGPAGARVVLTASTSDSCGEPSLSSTFGPGGVVDRLFRIGSHLVRWTARDEANNIAREDVRFDVVDTVGPLWDCPAELVVDCAGPGGASVPVVATVADLCTSEADLLVSNDRTCGGADATDVYPTGETLVRFTAIDGVSNEGTCLTRVVVRDEEPPAIDVAPTVSVECAGNLQAPVALPARASDACSGASVTNDRTGTDDASGSYPLGITSVEWTAEDGQDNTSLASTTVEVVDSLPPDLVCPLEVRAECTAGAGARVDVLASALDRCDPGPSVTNDRTAGGSDASGDYPIGTTHVRFEAVDSSGNVAPCVTRVVVTDARAPALDCAPLIRAACDGTGSAEVAVRAQANDCCDTDLAVANDRTASGLDASGTYPLGETLVSFTAEDDAGHVSTCETRVLVEDVRPPSVGCPAEVRAECLGPAGTFVSLTAFAADACDPSPSVVNDRTGGGADASGTYPVGETRVRFIATDGAGLGATCESRVVVEDTLPPLVVAETDDECLWPPNHRFVEFRLGEHLRVAAHDLCVGEDELILEVLDVVSSEPADGRGDGSTEPDVVVTDEALYLRAEREGGGPGRTYSVVLRVSDPSGNSADATVEIRVPSGGRAPDGCKALPPSRFVDP